MSRYIDADHIADDGKRGGGKMSRLIDADTLKEEILSWARVITNPKMLGTEDTMYIIDSAPTVDAVKVVRCKNCRKQLICYHSDNYFCADGERIVNESSGS